MESKIQDLEARLRFHEASEYHFSRFSALRGPGSPVLSRHFTSQSSTDNQSSELVQVIQKSENVSVASGDLDSKLAHSNTPKTSANGSLVSILNVDSSDPSKIPSSFSVISSLLKESSSENIKGSISSLASSASSISGSSNLTSDSDSSQSTDTTDLSIPSHGSKSTSNDCDSYLMPLDIDVSEFLSFDIAEPVNDGIGLKILQFLKVKNQFRFPILRHNDFETLHKKRFEKAVDPDDSDWNFDQFFLYMTYALCILSFLGVSSRKHFATPEKLDPYTFYHRALIHARKCKNPGYMKQIQCLAMCSFFQIRQDISRGLHWTLIDKAMSIAKSNNLHKKAELEKYSILEQEDKLRAFWSLYQLERLMSFERGVPYIIPESEIDVPLFANVNETEKDESVILKARAMADDEKFKLKNYTSLTFSLHGLKLTTIEAKIIDTIYCEEKSVEEQFKYVEYFLRELDDWKAKTPGDYGYTQVMIEIYHARAVRLLLQPFIGFMDPTSPLFIRCMRQTGQIAQGCAEMSRVIKGYNLITASMLFVSGLTLIYGLWLASKSTLNFQFIIEDIRLCTCTFYALAERSTMFNHYRDTIDNLASATIRHVAETPSSKVQISRTVTGVLPQENSKTTDDSKSEPLKYDSFQDFTKASFATKKEFAEFRKEMDNQIEKAYEEEKIERKKQQTGKWAHLSDQAFAQPGGNTDEAKAGGKGKRIEIKLEELTEEEELQNFKKRKLDSVSENDDLMTILNSSFSRIPDTNIDAQVAPNPDACLDSSGLNSNVDMSYIPFVQDLASTPSNEQKTATLPDRFALNGSSINWWKNLEHRIVSRENNGNWINTLGTNDGVSNWIHDLSNFAQKRLNNTCCPNNGNHINNAVGSQNTGKSGAQISAIMMPSVQESVLDVNGNKNELSTGRDIGMLAALGGFSSLNPNALGVDQKGMLPFSQGIGSSDINISSRSNTPSSEIKASSQYNYSFGFQKPGLPPEPASSSSIGQPEMTTNATGGSSTTASDTTLGSSSYTSQQTVDVKSQLGEMASSFKQPEMVDPQPSTGGYAKSLGMCLGQGHLHHSGIGFESLGSLPGKLGMNSAATTVKRRSPSQSNSSNAANLYSNLPNIESQGDLLATNATNASNVGTANPGNGVNHSMFQANANMALGQDPEAYPSWSWDLNVLDFDDLVTWSL